MKRLALATLVFCTAGIMSPGLALTAKVEAPTSALSIPVTGTGGGAVFSGTCQLQKFATQDGALVATGILSGVVTTARRLYCFTTHTARPSAPTAFCRCD